MIPPCFYSLLLKLLVFLHLSQNESNWQNNPKRFFLLSSQSLKTSQWIDEKAEMKNSYEVRAGELKHLSLVKENIGIFLRRNEGWLEKDCKPREMHAPVFPGGQISQVGTCCEKELFPEQINSLLREHCHLSPYTPREIGLSKEILVWNWWGSSVIWGKWLKVTKVVKASVVKKVLSCFSLNENLVFIL